MSDQTATILRPLGLDSTFVGAPKGGGFALNRIDSSKAEISLIHLGDVGCFSAPVIGRVGPPDPRLCVRWQASLTFYGKRFDEIGQSDPMWVARRRIASQPPALALRNMVKKIEFAFIGSHYASFRAILDAGLGLPCILLDTRNEFRCSLPVALLDLRSDSLRRHYETVLRELMGIGNAPKNRAASSPLNPGTLARPILTNAAMSPAQ